MKNILALSSLFFLVSKVFAQGIPVSHTVEKKNVVLEEFTGIHCPWCPDGHKIAAQLHANYPGDVVLINVHEGSYAVPNTGEPDFRTNFGASLAGMSDLTGYPAGTINRHVFTSLGQVQGSSTALSRNEWTSAATQIFAQNASCNVGVEAQIDVQSRLLTVHVQVYYTGSPSLPNNNRINVAVLQDNVEGPQTGGANLNPDQVLPNGNYMHQHILRHLITGQYGKQMSFVSQGMTIDSIFTYTLPESIRSVPLVLQDIKIAAFVSDGLEEILNGHEITPTFTNFPSAVNSKVVSVNVDNTPLCGFTASPVARIQNFGNQTLTSLFIDYSINGSPVKTYYWTGSLSPIGETEISLNDIIFFPLASNTLTLSTRLPNGTDDGDVSDDEVEVTFESAPDVNNTVNMTLKLDNYGSEVTWEVVNSAQSELYSGGPYTNNNPATITVTFDLASNDCYEFIIHDSYGDGMLGAGKGVTLTDANNIAIVSNYGTYGAGGKVSFGVDAPQPDSSDVFTSIADIGFPGEVSVYPNPVVGKINVNLSLLTEEILSINITNSLGQIVVQLPQSTRIGNSSISIDATGLNPGVYFLNVVVDEKRFLQKILVSR